ncbi:hypothetical protein FHU41_000879 [Psychromicrobium silvestre]|uniref:Excreted virulence factor EspC, type VII ESX diderm n=1 Tax=Psychromicrobium silvestre TaxID=1645614 RepID=A0A7Y9LS98_9MICC|nr:hypothetical protein [Psychromicrobium silvestre]NYE94658.1 hypothetical protein [Psychromicrobium silvestre]
MSDLLTSTAFFESRAKTVLGVSGDLTAAVAIPVMDAGTGGFAHAVEAVNSALKDQIAEAQELFYAAAQGIRSAAQSFTAADQSLAGKLPHGVTLS